MIDYQRLINTVVKGLYVFVGCPVIPSNRTAEPPKYPYISYTITTPSSANKGTWEEYADTARKQVTQIWSITAFSNDDIESLTLANKARDWLDYVGRMYLKDRGITVQSVGAVTPRDNVLTVGYEYKKGFDCFFTCDDIVNMPEVETIETVEFDADIRG